MFTIELIYVIAGTAMLLQKIISTLCYKMHVMHISEVFKMSLHNWKWTTCIINEPSLVMVFCHIGTPYYCILFIRGNHSFIIVLASVVSLALLWRIIHLGILGAASKGHLVPTGLLWLGAIMCGLRCFFLFCFLKKGM